MPSRQRIPVFFDSRSPFGQTFSGYCAVQPMASYWRWRYLRCLSNVGASFLLLMTEPYKREEIPKRIPLDCSGSVFTQSSADKEAGPGLQEINIIFPDAKHGAFIGSVESLTLCSSLNLTLIECLPDREFLCSLTPDHRLDKPSPDIAPYSQWLPIGDGGGGGIYDAFLMWVPHSFS
ncbi:hypothetical protein CDAR_87571 [Caerostris darwini]|uniref:Uncharacterized protein n=1 Tax=Caerostris darwini TaxID=1538125 RepID=A0AAV4X0P9_9ARAC|nr:hypothetical protein CDAR_87571 [Caerostris darwini]